MDGSTLNTGNTGGVIVTKEYRHFRPIRVQSVMAPYSDVSEKSPMKAVKNASAFGGPSGGVQAAGAGGGNYKVSYLNKPSVNLMSATSSVLPNKKSLEATDKMNRTSNTVFKGVGAKGSNDYNASEFGQTNAAAIYGATINQDSKMSFKDYIELHHF